jgi:hypothetical protein
LHIGLYTSIIETYNEKVGNLGNFAVIGRIPTEYIGKVEVAVLLLGGVHIIVEQWLVSHCYNMKINMLLLYH